MARAVKIDEATLVAVAASFGYKHRGADQFECTCGRCGGVGGSRAWPGYTCWECHGVGVVGVPYSRVRKVVVRDLKARAELQAQRDRNGGLTDAEVQQAEMQAQRDRNGGLTDAELAEKQSRDAEAARVAAEVAAKEAAAQNDLARVQALYPVGERLTFTGARIEKTFSGIGSYGGWTLTKMRLPSNQVVLYWNRVGTEGEDFDFKATVKAVEVNRGEVAVIVQRAKELAKV